MNKFVNKTQNNVANPKKRKQSGTVQPDEPLILR